MQAVALLSSTLLLIALDQSAKALVIHSCRDRQPIHFGGVAIRHLLNRQAFGGALQKRAILLSLLAAETALLVIAVQFVPVFNGVTAAVGFGLAVGGAVSNTLDQVLRCGVVDFIDLGFWPVFNLADIAIVVGVVTGIACL